MTSRQRVLDAVRSLIAETGCSPTIREIGARAGLRSSSSVQHHVDALVAAGLLLRSADRARTIRPLGGVYLLPPSPSRTSGSAHRSLRV